MRRRIIKTKVLKSAFGGYYTQGDEMYSQEELKKAFEDQQQESNNTALAVGPNFLESEPEKKIVMCTDCNGTGFIDDEICEECTGAGDFSVTVRK